MLLQTKYLVEKKVLTEKPQFTIIVFTDNHLLV